ncbi:MAG: hypothetical protein ACM3JH_01220 [Acidithiobacillales bacterium]
MPYTVDVREGSTVISLSAKTREEFVRDLVTSLLEAAYGAHPEGAAAGRVVPIQAAGADEAQILAHLAEGTLRAVRETAGKLLPPRWIALDEGRVTAVLPVVDNGGPPPRLTARSTSLERPLPELRARLELAVS